MGQVRFRDLAPLERDVICNGCGPKGGWVPVPDWTFEACCDHHDFNYWLGYREADRERADEQFYRAMLRDTMRHPRWKRWWLRLMAWTYYRAVRRWGAPSFYYGRRERTREDLEKEIERLSS